MVATHERVPKALICQKTEEELLKMLQENLRPDDGPVGRALLEIALANADLQKEQNLPRLFSLACQVMVKSGHPDAVDEVVQLIWRLLDNHKLLFSKDLAYNSHHVNDACAKYIHLVVNEAKKEKQPLPYEQRTQVTNILSHLESLYSSPKIPLITNVDSCNAFIVFQCYRGDPNKALQRLQWMVNAATHHPVDIIPRVATFATIISAFAKSDPEKSLEVLQWMMKLHRDHPKVFPPPNTICFNALLNAFAKSGRNDAGPKAEQTLEWMQQLVDSEGLDTAPNQISFNSAINAWANSPVPDAAKHAESLLRKMISKYQNGSDVAPSHVSFGSAMNAWANSGLPEAPERVATLLDVMKALAKDSKDLKVDSYSYSSLLKAWEVMGQKSNNRQSHEYVDKIFGVLRQMDEDGIEKTAPTHNSVIMAMSSFSAHSAILYFLEVETLYRNGKATIDTRTFNSALSAMAMLSKPDVAERAQDVLDRMREYSKKDPSVTPNQTTLNVMLKILSRSHSPDAALKADNMILEMEGQKSWKTSQAAYVTAIIAWGRSTDEMKYDRVQNLLRRYRKSANAKSITNPSAAHTYNAALSVCRHHSENDKATKDKAIKTLWFTMSQMRSVKFMKPDHNSYLTLFNALKHLMQEDNHELHVAFDTEFQNCIKDGLVSRHILSTVYDGSLECFQKHFGPNQTPRTVDIPHIWSKRLLPIDKKS